MGPVRKNNQRRVPSKPPDPPDRRFSTSNKSIQESLTPPDAKVHLRIGEKQVWKSSLNDSQSKIQPLKGAQVCNGMAADKLINGTVVQGLGASSFVVSSAIGASSPRPCSVIPVELRPKPPEKRVWRSEFLNSEEFRKEVLKDEILIPGNSISDCLPNDSINQEMEGDESMVDMVAKGDGAKVDVTVSTAEASSPFPDAVKPNPTAAYARVT